MGNEQVVSLRVGCDCLLRGDEELGADERSITTSVKVHKDRLMRRAAATGLGHGCWHGEAWEDTRLGGTAAPEVTTAPRPAR